MTDDPLPSNRVERLARLEHVVLALLSAYDEYATVWEAERLEKAASISQAQSNGWAQGVTSDWVMAHTAPHAVETVKVAQWIKQLEAERDHLQFMITHA